MLQPKIITNGRGAGILEKLETRPKRGPHDTPEITVLAWIGWIVFGSFAVFHCI